MEPDSEVQRMGLRSLIRAEVRAITPFDELERAHLAQALVWVDSGVDLFRLQKPALPPQHLVSYFVCIDGDHVLLVDHRDAGLWLPTGGHVEPGEHPRETVRRELYEELGVTAKLAFERPLMLTITETVGHSIGHRDVSLWYVVALRRDACIRFDVREFREVHWFDLRALPLRRTDPHLARFVAKLQFERGFGTRAQATVAPGAGDGRESKDSYQGSLRSGQ